MRLEKTAVLERYYASACVRNIFFENNVIIINQWKIFSKRTQKSDKFNSVGLLVRNFRTKKAKELYVLGIWELELEKSSMATEEGTKEVFNYNMYVVAAQ